MVDLACAAGVLLVLALLVSTYAVRVITSGAAVFDRVKRDKGSVLLSAGAMHMAYWGLDPLGRGLARLGVSANAVTASSLVLGALAGLAMALGHFGVAAAVTTAGSLCDALDGIVARHTKTASESGEVLDASVDRYVEFAFLAGLAIFVQGRALWLGLVLAAMLGSFMVSYASAKAETFGVEVCRGAMRRPERAVYLTLGATLSPFVAAWAAASGRPASLGMAPMLAATSMVALIGNVSAVQRLAATARALRERRRPAPEPERGAHVAHDARGVAGG
jgi:CDP-diacylglycerol--glycerol-3-phosphate 3-phosphatidyltransferase